MSLIKIFSHKKWTLQWKYLKRFVKFSGQVETKHLWISSNAYGLTRISVYVSIPLVRSSVESNLNKKSFPPKTHPPLLIVLIGCAAGWKQLNGWLYQKSNISSSDLTKTTVKIFPNYSQSLLLYSFLGPKIMNLAWSVIAMAVKWQIYLEYSKAMPLSFLLEISK